MQNTPTPSRLYLLHLIALILTLTSLATGLRIATMDHPWVLTLSALLPQGMMHTVHLTSAVGWIALALIMLMMAPRLKQAASRRFATDPVSRWMTLWMVGSLGVTLLSGLALYFDWLPTLPRLQIHFIGALGFAGYLLAHLSLKWVRRGVGVLRAFLPLPLHRSDWLLAGGWITVSLVLGMVAIHRYTTIPLRVYHAHEDEAVRIDGNASDPIWSRCPEATVVTFGGANFPNGQSPIRVRAFENGREWYLLVQWRDPDRSLAHLPLQKTPKGWRITTDGFYRWDERTWYEDKLAILATYNTLPGAGGTAHLGPKPLGDKPPCWHHRGYHYTDDGSHLDLWQWKAVRINDMHQMDDEYFGPPGPVRVGNRRYKAGYHPDPKLSGGMRMNWTWYHRDGITPKRLPSDPALLSDYHPTQGQSGKGYHSWYDYVPYHKANDTLPTGTFMPSVLYISNKYEGDRGDVQAYATWHDGWWTLEMVRFLASSSHYDLPIHDGLRLWFAAFDHAQTAHTRSARAIELHFEE